MAGASGELPGKEQIICSGLYSGRMDVLPDLLRPFPNIVPDAAMKVVISQFRSSSPSKAVVKLH